MLESSIIYIITRTIPESMMFMICAVIMLDAKISKIDILRKGVILGCIIAGIRILPINFGVHTILSMISLWAMIYKYINQELIKSMICTCEIFISLMLSEGVYIGIMRGIFNVPFEVLSNNKDIEGALITLPSLIVLLALIMLIKKVKITFFKTQKEVN